MTDRGPARARSPRLPIRPAATRAAPDRNVAAKAGGWPTAALPVRWLGAPQAGGRPVSAVALGCAGLAGTWNPAEFGDAQLRKGVGAIAAAWAAGITFFDFADIYGNGLAETVWRAACAAVPDLRAGAVVCTKAGVRRASGDAVYQYDATPVHLEGAVEGSLRRLGMDRVDLLLIHRPDPLAHPRDTANALRSLVRDGRVGAVGVSNRTPSQVRALRAHLDVPLAASQPPLSLWNLQAMEDGTLDLCEEMGLLPMAYSPLARGLLAGRRSLHEDDPGRVRLGGLVFELERCAAERGCTATQAALAWVLAHPAGAVAIVGSRDAAHIREAAGACRVVLTRDDWYRLWVAARGAPIP